MLESTKSNEFYECDNIEVDQIHTESNEIYTNRAKENLTAEFTIDESGIGTVEVIDLHGKHLLQESMPFNRDINKINLSIRDLSAGCIFR